MSEIIAFPTRQTRGWVEVERGIRDVFNQSDITPCEEAEVLVQMKAFFNLVNFDFTFVAQGGHAAIDNEVKRLSLALQEFTGELMLDRMKREMEVIALKRPL